MGRLLFLRETAGGLFAEQAIHGFALVTGHAKLFAALEHDDVAALKPWLHLANATHVDDGGAMDADEFAGIELFHQCLQSFAHVIDLA